MAKMHKIELPLGSKTNDVSELTYVIRIIHMAGQRCTLAFVLNYLDQNDGITDNYEGHWQAITADKVYNCVGHGEGIALRT